MISKRTLYLIFLFLIIFGTDFFLKSYINEHLRLISFSSRYPFGGIGVFSDWHGIDFSIVHVVNKGAAWGIFSSLQDYLLYMRVLIIGALLSYLVFVQSSSFRKFCLTLIFAGACGNVLDYFLYGHVIDMFYFIFFGYSYPVFNIADVSIFCGVTLLLMQALINKCKSNSGSSSLKTRP